MNTESIQGVCLDEDDLTLSAGEAREGLTGMEFRMLKAMFSKNGALVTRSELRHALYADKGSVAESNVLEVLVSRVRKKLKAVGAATQIKTIRGSGYKLVGGTQ